MKTLVLITLLASAMPAMAQLSPPPVAASADPKLQAAHKAFEALPESERKAIQQDLGFVTSFNGAAQGAFGTLTYNAIQGFERDNKLVVDGILTPQERQLLAIQALNIRRALKFALVDDKPSGIRIGVPQNVFPHVAANASGGSRWQTADKKATLDSLSLPKGGGTLPQLFEKASQSSPPARKVTYKLLRPDFFVVAGETPTGKFYRRMALGGDGSIRGFSIGYDKVIAKELDKLVIDMANSFDPFPTSAVATPTTAAAATQAPVVAKARLASALIVDAGMMLTAEVAVKECRTITVGTRKLPARVAANDAATGLALLKADGVPRPDQLLSLGDTMQPEQSLTFMANAWSGLTPAGVYGQAIVAGPGRIGAPLQTGGAGAALFDNTGNLMGLVSDDPGARKQIAGIVPLARYRYAGSEAMRAFLHKNGASLPNAAQGKSNNNVASMRANVILPLLCEP